MISSGNYEWENKLNNVNYSKTKLSIDLRRLKYASIGVCFFYLVANGFALFNYIPQHDALNYINDFAGFWEIRLGRFMLPVYERIRGEITMPWLIGVISMACLTAITYVLTDLLEIRKPFLIMIAAAFLSANITHTELLSSFTYVADACMLAALMACLFVYILDRMNSRKRVIVSVSVMVLSLGIYQAYFSFAATLIILLSVKEIINSGKFQGKEVKKFLGYFSLLILSSLIYFLLKKIIMNILGVQGLSDYHSLTGFLNDLGSLPSRIFVAYGSKFSMFFIRKEMNLGRIANCLLVLAAAFIVSRLFRIRKVDFRTQIIFLILLFVSSFTALMINIGAGMISYRLSYAVFLYYLFLISLMEMILHSLDATIKNMWPVGISVCLLFLVIWSNIVYSNGAYTIQKVIFDRSISLYTRVLDDMYEIPEYVHNSTPVVILGDWSFDDYAYDYAKKEFRDLGTFMNTSVTYRQTVGNLMRYLGEDIQLIGDDTVIKSVTEHPEVQKMPSFPMKGYCRMVDDFLVINF